MNDDEKKTQDSVAELQKQLNLLQTKRDSDFIFFETRLQELQAQLNFVQTQYENGQSKKSGCFKYVIVALLIAVIIDIIIGHM